MSLVLEAIDLGLLRAVSKLWQEQAKNIKLNKAPALDMIILAFGFWLLAFGFWLLAFGFWLKIHFLSSLLDYLYLPKLNFIAGKVKFFCLT